jgi:hypothetical protein
MKLRVELYLGVRDELGRIPGAEPLSRITSSKNLPAVELHVIVDFGYCNFGESAPEVCDISPLSSEAGPAAVSANSY